MRAKFVDRNHQTPFATHSSLRNNQYSGRYALSRLQYEDADKPEEDEEDEEDETLDEKFIEETDPISDMEIGGINFEEVYTNLKEEIAKKWVKTLNDTLKGKTIRCIAGKWDVIPTNLPKSLNVTGKLYNERRGDWKEHIIKVAKVNNTLEINGFSRVIILTDDNGEIYTLLLKRKVYIIK